MGEPPPWSLQGCRGSKGREDSLLLRDASGWRHLGKVGRVWVGQGLWCSADCRYRPVLEGLCECVLGLWQTTMLPAHCRHPPLPSCSSWQALLGVCSRCLWFISAEVLSSSAVLIECGLGVARGSCDEDDGGNTQHVPLLSSSCLPTSSHRQHCPCSKGTCVPSPWCPSPSLLLLPVHWWGSCVGKRSAHSHGVWCLTRGMGFLRLFQ